MGLFKFGLLMMIMVNLLRRNVARLVLRSDLIDYLFRIERRPLRYILAFSLYLGMSFVAMLPCLWFVPELSLREGIEGAILVGSVLGLLVGAGEVYERERKAKELSKTTSQASWKPPLI